MKILDVGCGTAKIKEAIGIDIVKLPGVDVVHNLNEFPWPFEEESFDEIYMNDILEHLNNTVKVMEECHRLLKVRGKLHIKVPYWNHRHSFGDPTHVRYFSDNVWQFFTGERRSYYTKARFKKEKIEYTYDSKARKIFISKKLMNFLSYFLCNIKDGMIIILVKE